MSYRVRMCSVYIANNRNRKHVHVPKCAHFPTTGYARVLLFMFIRRELGGTGTGCLFQFTYCDVLFGTNMSRQTVQSVRIKLSPNVSS